MRSTRTSEGIDWFLIIMILVVMAFGVANIYSVDPAYGVKQIVRIALGFGMIFFFLIVSSMVRNFFDIYALGFYALGVLALVGVLFFGKETNGAKAWYSIGGVGVQPVELMKISTGLMIAHLLNIPGNNLEKTKTLFTCFALLGIPTVLILLQPDVGSLFVFGAFLLAMYREGMNPVLLIVPFVLAGVFLLSIVWDYQIFMLGVGIVFWLLQSISILIFVNKRFSVQMMHSLMGSYIGLGLYFMSFIYLSNALSFSGQVPDLIQNYMTYSVAMLALLFSILSFVSAISIYFSFQTITESFKNFTRIKSSNSRQVILGSVSMLLGLGLLFGISYNASKILEKLPKHQRERIMVLFEGEAKYRDTSGYNLLYSKTAIGSGEMWGSGWNKGTVTDGRFVPEQWTDYIFCTVGEEWGFVGCTALVLLYALIIGRIFYLAEQQKVVFSRYFGYSVGSILLLHYFVNIGMVTGLFPTVGIPLPFLSYGGSSLWGFMLMLFIFLKLNYDGKQTFI